MKILFISQLFPYEKGDLNTTGALREFIEQWAESGHFIKVIRTHYSHEKEKFPPKSSYKIGDNIIVNFIKPTRIPVLKLSYYSNKRIINDLGFKPDILICHHYNAYFTFYKLANKLNIPLILGIHMSDIRLAQKWFYRWHFKKIYKYASGFACRSHAYMAEFKNLFPNHSSKAFLAMSGIPEKYLKPLKKRENICIEFITVSSLIKRKQVDKILTSLSLLPKNIQWNLSIIGDGPEKLSLMNLSTKLNISNDVKFLGQKSRDEVFELLKNADIFVLPSFNETFGLVYLEAMAAGCLTIGSYNEGIDGIIINNKNGFLCDPYQEHSINETILNVAQLDIEEKEQILSNAHETVVGYSNFSMAASYFDKIKQIRDDYH